MAKKIIIIYYETVQRFGWKYSKQHFELYISTMSWALIWYTPHKSELGLYWQCNARSAAYCTCSGQVRVSSRSLCMGYIGVREYLCIMYIYKINISPSSNINISCREMLELEDALETDADRVDLGKSPISLSFLRRLI